MNKLMKKDGFTLIELMIVVVIIGILASVAIPQFLKYQLKSKTTEATRNIGAIKTNEESISGKYPCLNAGVLGTSPGCYPLASATPPLAGLVAAKRTWTVNTAGYGFDLLGFAPSGAVYYTYDVRVAGTLTPSAATCAGSVSTAAPAAGGDGYVALDAGNRPGIVNGAGRTGTNDVVFWSATGNLDADGNTSCFLMGDWSGEIIPIPGGSGESVF